MTTTVSQAVAQRDSSPVGLIRQYSDSFARVLPSQVKPDTWVRLAEGAMKKGKRITARNDPNFGRFELEVAAANNPGVFLAALLDAARLGLEPGTESYYLTPRKVGGRLEILGIVGYQGHIELMYRAGAVTAVVVKVVRERDDYHFVAGSIDGHQPPRWIGPQEVPYHWHTPFARDADRGDLVGVYAYARMVGGAVSQVVELNQDDIDRIKRSSQGSASEYSPWVNHTAQMWMKSAARQLKKWVPTSAEYRTAQAGADIRAREVAEAHDFPAPPSEGVLDGELVEDWPAVEQPPADEATS